LAIWICVSDDSDKKISHDESPAFPSAAEAFSSWTFLRKARIPRKARRGLCQKADAQESEALARFFWKILVNALLTHRWRQMLGERTPGVHAWDVLKC
jgi:hypothetical protein